MLILLFLFSTLGLAVLLPIYTIAVPDGPTNDFYMRACIRNVRVTSVLWVTFAAMIACTFFLFYCIYFFYRNYIVARQAYMKSPSSFQALVKIESYAGKLKSYSQCIKYFDVLSRTVIVTGISSQYSKDRIQAIFEDMRLGNIQSIFIAKDRSLIMEKLHQVNECHERLEVLLNKFYTKLYKLSQKDNPEIKSILNTMNSDSLSHGEMKKIMEIISSPDFYPTLRGKYEPKGSKDKVDAINYFYNELLTAQAEMNDLIHHYIHDLDDPLVSPLPYGGNGSPNSGFVKAQADAYKDFTSMISVDGLIHVRNNVDDVSLTLWGTSSSAVIIFDDWKSATIANQALLSSRPFAFSVEPAPMATEVDWDNLYMPRADRSFRRFLGEVIYVILNIFFSGFMALFVKLLDLETLTSWSSTLKEFLERNPTVKDYISGVLGPLAVNIFFSIIPYILLVLTYYQAYVDKAKVQLQIMNKYSWLLFIQTFVVVMAGPVSELIEAVSMQNWEPLMVTLNKKVTNASALFFNIIMQKAFIGMMIVITKPPDILTAFLMRIIKPIRTPRAERDLNKPANQPLGFLYPEHAVIVFQMCLAFAFITPLILPIGAIFFGFAYFIFRALLIFSDKIPHETGGLFWPSIATHMIFAMFLAQTFTMVQFALMKASLQAFLTLPIIFTTIVGMVVLKRRFNRRVKYIALCGEAQEASLRLIQEQNELRDYVLNRLESPPDCDNTTDSSSASPDRPKHAFEVFHVDHDLEDDRSMSEISLESQLDLSNNPYTNPVIFKRLRVLMLPLHFYSLIQYLQEHPIQNV